MNAEEVRQLERATVGRLLYRSQPGANQVDALDVLDKLEPGDFSDDDARNVFAAMGAAYSDTTGGASVEAIIRRDPRITFATLSELMEAGGRFSLQSLDDMAAAVARAAKVRRVSASLKAAACDAGTDPDKALDAVLLLADREEGRRAGKGPELITAAEEWRRMQTEAVEHQRRGMVGIPSGFRGLDRISGGFRPGWLVVGGGKTSVGKSLLAVGAVSQAIRDGRRALIVSVEMSVRTYRARLAAWGTGIPVSRQEMGDLRAGEAVALARAYGEQDAAGLVIRDDVADLEEIARLAMKEKARAGLSLVVVDFLQNVTVRGMVSIYERNAAVAIRLQSLAKQIDAPIFALSQLSNETAREGVKGLLAFRGAGEIAHAADLAFTILDLDGDDTARRLAVRKHRHGGLGEIKLRFNDSFTRFEEEHERAFWRGNRGLDYAARD